MSNEENFALFGDRVERIETAHRKQRRQSIIRLNRDERAPAPWFSLSKVFLIVAICIVLKALAISQLSEGTYRTHVMDMQTGGTVERLVGLLLTPDRFSLELSRHLSL